jgi:hypothetical protein
MTIPRPKHEPDRELTARPRRAAEDLTTRPVSEQGLSIDPEDIGRQWLSDATEQGNFESSSGGDTPEISITGGAPSDDPLPGPNFESDHSVWESTVELSMQSGGPDEALEDVSPEGNEQSQGLTFGAREVDLSGESVTEMSLLDEEGEELGDTVAPDINAEDDGGRRRPGAGRRRRPASP